MCEQVSVSVSVSVSVEECEEWVLTRVFGRSYGYRGHQCRNNARYTASESVAYFTAGVGIVYDPRKHTQRYHVKNDDDILSLAVHPNGKYVATGQIGKEPIVCVWDTETGDTLSILRGVHSIGVCALAFSGDGKYLASVGLDNYHTLAVWDWKQGRVVGSTRGHTSVIYDVAWAPDGRSALVTCGQKHIKVWSIAGNTLTAKSAVFGKAGSPQDAYSVVFRSSEEHLTGMANGEIFRWKGTEFLGAWTGGHSAAVQTLFAVPGGGMVVSGDDDGVVCVWNARGQVDVKIDAKSMSTLALTSVASAGKGTTAGDMSVRSVCADAGEKGGAPSRLLVGIAGGEIMEISLAQDASGKRKFRTLTQGHAEGELWGLAVHPIKPMVATASDDQTLRLWDVENNLMLAAHALGGEGRSVAFSADGQEVAVGLRNGAFVVLKTKDLSEVVRVKDRKEVRHDMRYSPDGHHLAVASNDNFVDVYEVKNNYAHVGTCSGSSSFVTHLDWSSDSKYLQVCVMMCVMVCVIVCVCVCVCVMMCV
jgi:WD40 repeat protein